MKGLTFIVEAVDAVDRRALVVSSENEEVLGVLNFVRQEQADGFERLLATVDIVAKEEVVSSRGEAAVLEQAKQVVILAVDVAYSPEPGQKTGNNWYYYFLLLYTANLNGRLQFEQNGLRNEDFTGFHA
jgi:hypothetical protein